MDLFEKADKKQLESVMSDLYAYESAIELKRRLPENVFEDVEITVEDSIPYHKRSILRYVDKKGKEDFVKTNMSESYWRVRQGKRITIRVCKLSEDEWFVHMGQTVDSSIEELIDKLVKDESDRAEVSAKVKRLPEEQRKAIFKMITDCVSYSDVRTEKSTDAEKVAFGQKELEVMYQLCEDYFAPEIRRMIAMMDCERKEASTKDKEGIDKRKNLLLRMDSALKESDKNLTPEYILEKMKEKVYLPKKVERQLLNLLGTYNFCDEGPLGKAIAFTGPNAKEYAVALMEAMGRKWEPLNIGGKIDPVYMKGTSFKYDKGNFGHIALTLRDMGYYGGFLLEMKGALEAESITMVSSLLTRNFEDEYLERSVPLDKTMLVACADEKDARNMTAYFGNDMNYVCLPEFSDEDKKIVAKEYLVPEFYTKYGLLKKQVLIDEDVIDLLEIEYTHGSNLDEMRGNLDELFMEIAKLLDEKAKKKIHVTMRNLHGFVKDKSNQLDLQKSIYELEEIKNALIYDREKYADSILKRGWELYDECKSLSALEGEKRAGKLNSKLSMLSCLIRLRTPSQEEKEKDVLDFTYLDQEIYGLEKAKKEIKKYMLSRKTTMTDKKMCLLLDGPYGIGKTSLALGVAKAYGLPLVKIGLNGISSGSTLKGYSMNYVDPQMSLIARKLSEAGRLGAVVLLDEIDKICKANNGGADPENALLDLLDDAGGYYDAGAECFIPTNQNIYIATSNRMDKISPALLSRMEVIRLSGYSEEEKLHIAKHYVIPKALREFDMEGKIVFDIEAIHSLVKDYCRAPGVRDVERAVTSIIREVILDHNGHVLTACADCEVMKSALGPVPIVHDKYEDSQVVPGMARALGVAGAVGASFWVEAAKIFGSTDQVTGLVKNSCKESIAVAKSVAESKLNQAIPALHIHFGDAGIEKDGPSAGITIFLAIMSLMMEKTLPNYAYTGELSLHGRILPIGGAKEKAIAAKQEGVEKVFMPLENYRQLKESGELEHLNIPIVPVQNVSELLELVFEKEVIKKTA